MMAGIVGGGTAMPAITSSCSGSLFGFTESVDTTVSTVNTIKVNLEELLREKYELRERLKELPLTWPVTVIAWFVKFQICVLKWIFLGLSVYQNKVRPRDNISAKITEAIRRGRIRKPSFYKTSGEFQKACSALPGVRTTNKKMLKRIYSRISYYYSFEQISEKTQEEVEAASALVDLQLGPINNFQHINDSNSSFHFQVESYSDAERCVAQPEDEHEASFNLKKNKSSEEFLQSTAIGFKDLDSEDDDNEKLANTGNSTCIEESGKNFIGVGIKNMDVKLSTLMDTLSKSIGTDEESFQADFLRAIRSRPSNKTELNRDVLMVNGKIIEKFSKKKAIEDMLRCEYEKHNNACDINFNSIRINKNTFIAYAYCKDNACNSFVFKGKNNGQIIVLRNKEMLSHTIGNEKTYQLRAIQRYVEKAEIIKKSAVEYRKSKLNQQSQIIKKVGKQQNVRSLEHCRKLKSEALGEFDYHIEPFIDAYIMSQGPYKGYIQHLSTELDVYLYRHEQIQILQKNRNFVLKKCDFTLQIDATGGIISKNISCTEKRILLYSIVGHIVDEKITFSVADGILSNHTTYDIGKFLHHIKNFCSANNMKWPICKRFITDVSFAIIGAILKECNDMSTVLQYLNTCASYVDKPEKKMPFVIVQFCTSHYSKIMMKDIDRIVAETNVGLRSFLREALGLAYDFISIRQVEQWFMCLSYILLSPRCNEDFIKNMQKFRNIIRNSDEVNPLFQTIEIVDDNSNEESNDLMSIAKGSPFRKRFDKIYIDIYNKTNTLKSDKDTLNRFYCPVFCKLLLEKYIAFLPMWTQILSYRITNKIKRPSNGAVESHFKTLKIYILRMSTLKLGRFIRENEKYSRSNLNLANNFLEQNESPIKAGDVIKATMTTGATKLGLVEKKTTESKGVVNQATKTPLKKIGPKEKLHKGYFGADSNKNILEITESWKKQNKLDKVKLKMFSPQFLSFHKTLDRLENSVKTIEMDTFHDHNYKSETNIKKKCFNIPYKNLQEINNNTEEFYVFRLKGLYKHFYGRNPPLDCYITLKDVTSTYSRCWLTNVIVDAGMHLLVKKSSSSAKLLPCQVESYCFKNQLVIKGAIRKNPDILIIPQLYHAHFYVVILNFIEKYVTCLDPFDNKKKENEFVTYYIQELKKVSKDDWTQKYMQKEQQKDGYNCGIFILQYIDKYLHNESLENLINHEDYREALKTQIVDNSDSMHDICLNCASDIKKSDFLQCDICQRKLCINCLRRNYGISNENIEEYKTFYKEFKCKMCNLNEITPKDIVGYMAAMDV